MFVARTYKYEEKKTGNTVGYSYWFCSICTVTQKRTSVRPLSGAIYCNPMFSRRPCLSGSSFYRSRLWLFSYPCDGTLCAYLSLLLLINRRKLLLSICLTLCKPSSSFTSVGGFKYRCIYANHLSWRLFYARHDFFCSDPNTCVYETKVKYIFISLENIYSRIRWTVSGSSSLIRTLSHIHKRTQVLNFPQVGRSQILQIVLSFLIHASTQRMSSLALYFFFSSFHIIFSGWPPPCERAKNSALLIFLWIQNFTACKR